MQATAIAHPNIALIKYWGDLNPELHIPANGSISMNLEELSTQTTVSFDDALPRDELILNGAPMHGVIIERVRSFLDRVRRMAGSSAFARVESENNFPMAAGIASSASGFAALALAASRAAGLELDEAELSRLARSGSGSACRSIPAGFVEWHAGNADMDSYAHSIASPDHWKLVDCIVLVSQDEKMISSSVGHALAHTSPLQQARLSGAPERLAMCREAILKRDFDELAQVTEHDCNLMHAVMITSSPPLFYWQPATLSIIEAIQLLRKAGSPVCYTIDAGPNVHMLCPADAAGKATEQLQALVAGSKLILAHPGGPTRLATDPISK